MSAFIVDKSDYAYLGSVLYKMSCGIAAKTIICDVVDDVYRENVKSIVNLYGEDHGFDVVSNIINDDDIIDVELNSDEVSSFVRFLSYQCCEHPGWGDSFAKRTLDSLVDVCSRFPNFGIEPWGCPDWFVRRYKDEVGG